MGGRGAKSGVKTRGENGLLPGELGNVVGIEQADIDWLMRKNLSEGEYYAVSLETPYIARETEKAYLLEWKTEHGKVSMWCPKSVYDKQSNLYDANGNIKLGDYVIHNNGTTTGMVYKITDTHTYIGTEQANVIKIRNENLHSKFKKDKDHQPNFKHEYKIGDKVNTTYGEGYVSAYDGTKLTIKVGKNSHSYINDKAIDKI